MQTVLGAVRLSSERTRCSQHVHWHQHSQIHSMYFVPSIPLKYTQCTQCSQHLFEVMVHGGNHSEQLIRFIFAPQQVPAQFNNVLLGMGAELSMKLLLRLHTRVEPRESLHATPSASFASGPASLRLRSPRRRAKIRTSPARSQGERACMGLTTARLFAGLQAWLCLVPVPGP